MKALIASSYAPVDQLSVAEVPTPSPGPGEVLVKVVAAALNPLDAKLATGELKEMFPVQHPFVLGMDAVGIVTAVGEAVSGFAVGDDVAVYGRGTLAEYAVVPVGPGLVHLPSGLDAVRGAALITVAMTAECVIAAAEVKPDHDVLVVGATGGVGGLVVQLAAQEGARVFATAAPADTDYARDLGAHLTIDHTGTDTVEEALRLHHEGFDTVIDLVNAGAALTATAPAVRRGGRLVSTLYGPEVIGDLTPVYVYMTPESGDLARQAARVAEGRLAVDVAATYPFARSPQAVADLVAGVYTRGKVVVTF
ncbi:NADP-dependent oxidoreductase [Nonomuraea africana]|uniref:NADPH:quinone reductase-like Zn-dependent oxidoreductase n=1 Tax=Nonomuraea africana TaxID=46171 RepID=A0ABR9KEH0_9ACTN|nr:NADP-dependent oxidoreductase [Nonomuraea africana]MBE1560220.1 NADPH:quinone reductase-like Zn-dependent oxidoreductase [Nonomuraea africana]